MEATMDKLVIKQGEAKTITFTVTDALGIAEDISQATLLLGVKKNKTDVAYILSKEDAAFDKTAAATGVVTVDLSATDTNQTEGTYIGELKCAWAGPIIKKSEDFFFQIKRAVTA
jgi:hypothetical protein